MCAVEDLLDELAIKYLLNLPEEEYSNEVQLCYAFQVAHWEYLDAPETEHLHHKLTFSNFVVSILDRIPELGLNKADVPVRNKLLPLV
jgi:Dcp2, box A domain